MKAAATLALVSIALGAASCAQSTARAQRPTNVRLAACSRLPASSTTVISGPPDVVAADLARGLFACAPVIVVANARNPTSLAIAATEAERADAPLLLTGAA